MHCREAALKEKPAYYPHPCFAPEIRIRIFVAGYTHKNMVGNTLKIYFLRLTHKVSLLTIARHCNSKFEIFLILLVFLQFKDAFRG